jgi:hypothetical protein
VLFPDLPTGAIQPGHKWSVTRNTEIGTTKAHIDIAYNFEYLGDGACPSGTPSCGLLMFTASAPPADAVTEEGRKVRVGYGFAGKVFFDHDRGAIDESRVRADLDVTVEGMQMPMAATYILKPVR